LIGTGDGHLENEEFIREFLEESEENLDQLDQDFVSLEQNPGDLERLDSIYRAIHTIKGTSGFFGFAKLGAVAHSAENLLSRLRDGEIKLNEEVTSALLDSVDAIRDILANIGRDAGEGDGDYRELNRVLDEFSSSALETAGNPDRSDEPVADGPTASGTVPHDTTTLPEKQQTKTEPADSLVAPDHLSSVEDTTGNEVTGDELTGDEVEGKGIIGRLSDKDSDIVLPESDSFHIAGPDETGTPDQFTGRSAIRVGPLSTTRDPVPDAGTVVAGPEPPRPQPSSSEGSIRVDVGLLNQLMDLVGELVLARNQLVQTESNEHDHRLNSVTQQVNRITTELQERVMQTRMQPIGNIWGKFPRLVRDLAVMCGKEVDLLLDGEETEVDKSLLEAIKDPLTHLIRNSIDHGIESTSERLSCGKNKRGQLHLRAWHQGGQVNIEISDNGQGIDPDRIREKAISKGILSVTDAATMTDQQLIELIFRPGFSTAAQVTGISGRGVGMDVVKTNIEKIGGSIDVQSKIGIGTSIRVKIPLTLAIVPALIISSDQQRFAIPQSHLVEMLHLNQSDQQDRIERLRGTPVYRLRGRLLPLVCLSELFGTGQSLADAQREHINVVVLQADACRFGLVVDHVERTEEIVVKALHRSLAVIPHLAGATVMGDGRVALILDVLGLATAIGMTLEELSQASEGPDLKTTEKPADHMLIFKLLSGRKLAIPLAEVDRLEDIQPSDIEQMDRMDAVQYRGQIMPLLPLAKLLDATEQTADGDEGPKHTASDAHKTIVIRVNGSHAGITVREIVDVAQQQGPMRLTNEPGHLIRGSAVIEGKVTDILDIDSVLNSFGIAKTSFTGADA
jgi:two-component system chemotaxis sensor kinase CheA